MDFNELADYDYELRCEMMDIAYALRILKTNGVPKENTSVKLLLAKLVELQRRCHSPYKLGYDDILTTTAVTGIPVPDP